MPRRTDIHRILVIGSGPIVIGQACEFDYSGTQACKALRAEGFEVILVNSNPATIMTDPEFADHTYVEPLTVEIAEKIIARHRPDAMLPTVGGQTGLNLAVALGEQGVLAKYGVELIGAKLEAVHKAEDRQQFKAAMQRIGLEVPRSGYASSIEEALAFVEEIRYPAIVRPSFTLGGAWGGTAYNVEEFRRIVGNGLKYSPVHQVLVEESVLGWKEYELEVMRDLRDNVVIICSIENFDPMGVHTGDSITVAPAQTLTDREYQRMRDASIAVIREIGVETGGSNIQFAVHPGTGRMVVIEMNPRVSRSSALASKATGFPIAKIAAKLAVGYTLDEIPNDITRSTPASFEPTIDYCVVKIPRWAFEKFPGADDTLGVSMKSVGEVMAMGRTFQEAFQKGLRSLEIGRFGFGADGRSMVEPEKLQEHLMRPTPRRIFYLHYALRVGWSVERLAQLTGIDPWFLRNLEDLIGLEGRLRSFRLDTIPGELLRRAKRAGYSDPQLAHLLSTTADAVRARRIEEGLRPVYKRVDTCGAEFEAKTPYLYSTYEEESEVEPTGRRKIVILGSGPNRIGQGIEFDYACVHASFALKEEGFETIMVNCNPETVSTDYDTSDRLYFEPLTLEDVLEIVEAEKPEGVIVQFGGQTPLRLALPLRNAGVRILGTSPESIDVAEDRSRFGALIERLGFRQPENGTATTLEEARSVAERIGYPVLVRPSYVLGGRAMHIVYDTPTLDRLFAEAAAASEDNPVLIDRFLEDAFEIDVDAVCDGTDVVVAGIMQHIEEAGIHSGDSACVLPPYRVTEAQQDEIRKVTRALALALEVRGLINIQFAIKEGILHVLEVNPRASRTVPFVSKATGVPWAKVAARVAAGRSLRDQGITREVRPRGYFIKESVFPWVRFLGVDPMLGPEMKSTGEVMGVSAFFGAAFAKSQIAAGNALPLRGTVFISVNDNDKVTILPIARDFHDLGFSIVATGGTAETLRRAGIPAESVFKVNEGRPHIADRMVNGEIDVVVNTPLGRASFYDETAIRKTAVQHGIPIVTTLSAAAAATEAIRTLREKGLDIRSLQEIHAGASGAGAEGA